MPYKLFWLCNLVLFLNLIGKESIKKREEKFQNKPKKRAAISPSDSKNSPSTRETQKSEKQAGTKKYPRNRVKKKDQYRNQVIVDQYGTFEFDKDPEGYKKARKRMLNRKSKF